MNKNADNDKILISYINYQIFLCYIKLTEKYFCNIYDKH